MSYLDVVGLSGKLGTGKDFIARKYFFPLGYHQFSLAWHFKVDIIGKREATYEEVFHIKPERVRDLLQKRGTEQGRLIYGENIWVDTMFAWFQVLNNYWQMDKFIVPDVRFPNEVEAIQKWGGRVYRIVAPIRNAEAHATPEARNHPSETSLDSYFLDQFDGVIHNDPQDVESLDFQLQRIIYAARKGV